LDPVYNIRRYGGQLYSEIYGMKSIGWQSHQDLIAIFPFKEAPSRIQKVSSSKVLRKSLADFQVKN